MSEHGHNAWEGELGAYALGALEPAERAACEQHLAGCEDCRVALERLGPAVAALPASVEPVAPPRRLRRAVMTAVRDDLAEKPARSPLRPALALAAIGAVAVAGATGYALRDSGDGVSTVTARATSALPQAANAVLRRDADTGTLVVRGMPPLAAGEVYQAWVRVGREIRPSRVLAVDRHGAGATVIDGLGPADEVMVTREPAGGSSKPSTAPLLRAPLT